MELEKENPDAPHTACALALLFLMAVNTFENAVATVCTNPTVSNVNTIEASEFDAQTSIEELCVAVIAAEETAFEKQLAAACATALLDWANACDVACEIADAVALP